MIVRKFSEAKPYEAPNHRGYKSFRVYGAEMGGSQSLVFGISHFLPGGGAGPIAQDVAGPVDAHITEAELLEGLAKQLATSGFLEWGRGSFAKADLILDGPRLAHPDGIERRLDQGILQQTGQVGLTLLGEQLRHDDCRHDRGDRDSGWDSLHDNGIVSPFAPN